ncbi:glycosyltransferase family 25 protein [Sulfurovum lithotrophicum]|nr:glycosyltransferase family 25 protein [Sulfurovum lithotrophicum]
MAKLISLLIDEGPKDTFNYIKQYLYEKKIRKKEYQIIQKFKNVNNLNIKTVKILTYGSNAELILQLKNIFSEKFEVDIVSEQKKKFTDDLYIIIDPQNVKYFPKNYIILSRNSQIPSSVYSKWHYFNVLKNAIAIFDSDLTHIAYLQQNNINYKRIFYIPINNKYHNLEFYIKRFLLSVDLINFSELPFDMLSQNNQKRYCLGLPENIERRESFLLDNKYNFSIFDGLRHYFGWKGCAYSYKYLIQYAKRNKWDYVIICEDDVLFSDDFEKKLESIIEYLTQTNHEWNIFSGLISDLHEDAEVSRIEFYKNTEFIYLNKMTSTVFNIYHKSIFDTLLRWNEKSDDVLINTIDRYIEAQKELKVVTIFPFLVDHKEEQASSIWNFQNDKYSDMLANSRETLKKKILEYKKRCEYE